VADNINCRIREVSPAGVVTTVAGNGFCTFADGTAGATGTAEFDFPEGVALDSAGDIFVGDSSNRVRMISDGQVTTFAGSGTQGFKDGPAASAEFNSPTDLAVDSLGNVYVADSGNSRIRKIDTTGTVTTLAGNGTAGFADGTGGATGTAELHFPNGVAVDAAGNVYVGDSANSRVRLIDLSGNVTTLAGTGAYAFADGSGAVAAFSEPAQLAVSPIGILVADEFNDRIRVIQP